MSGEHHGIAPPEKRKPLIERSRREYEVILVINPGAKISGIALGVVNPDGTAYHVSGRATWAEMKPYLAHVDLVIACYWNLVEEASAHTIAQEAREHGCVAEVRHATFRGIQAILPTRRERAVRTLERLMAPRGILFVDRGKLKRNYFMKMLPRAGERLA